MTTSPIASLPGRPRARLVPVVVMVVLVVLVVLAGPAALAGRATTALPGSCAAADGVHAGLVVDFGDVDAGSPRPADTADCVADPGANGATLLARRFGKDRIRISSTGLICAIDGYPAEGCGDHLPNGKYRYWSYWKGGSSWTYSQVGPAGRAISDGSVDGWHFVDGSAGPSDGAPGNSPPSGPCASAPPTTPTVTAPPSSVGGSGASGKPGSQAAPTSLPEGSVGASTDGSDPATDGDRGRRRGGIGRRIRCLVHGGRHRNDRQCR